MTSIDAYIYIVIGLLGVAYPVLLQVIARLDDKYSSDKIVELFNRHFIDWYEVFLSQFFDLVDHFAVNGGLHVNAFELFTRLHGFNNGFTANYQTTFFRALVLVFKISHYSKLSNNEGTGIYWIN